MVSTRASAVGGTGVRGWRCEMRLRRVSGGKSKKRGAGGVRSWVLGQGEQAAVGKPAGSVSISQVFSSS